VKCSTADLAAEHDIQALGTALQQEYGEIDILIHSAGYISLGPLEQAPVEELDRHYRINVRAPYLLTQLALPIMRPQRGQIVFVNSSIVQNARAGTSQYAASKYALQAIADSLRAEVNARGIRVLSVYPGRTATPMQAAVHAMEGRPYEPERFMQPEDVAAVVVHSLLLERTVEATDIAVRPLRKFS
jgi:NAD(P)-dependent dehydrogenase (short-subunit alcohol dehydrogenase family)